uniref:Uncharacterized protein n=1 Tax=Oryza sativa subsp. japonica TaxID=39947 RepID=Q654V8_ORYSJ|nr:hypothetical protein [Oryza sativa Japonica Group]
MPFSPPRAAAVSHRSFAALPLAGGGAIGGCPLLSDFGQRAKTDSDSELRLCSHVCAVAFSAPSVEARLPAIAAFSPARVSTPPCEPPRSPSSSPAPFSSESPHVVAPPPVTAATFSSPPALSAASPPPATAATSSSPSTASPFSTPLGDPASPSGISRAPPYPAATRVGTPSGEFHLRPQHRATRRRRAFLLLAIPLLAVGLLPHARL